MEYLKLIGNGFIVLTSYIVGSMIKDYIYIKKEERLKQDYINSCNNSLKLKLLVCLFDRRLLRVFTRKSQ